MGSDQTKSRLFKVWKDELYIPTLFWAISLLTTCASFFAVSVLRHESLSSVFSSWDGGYYKQLVQNWYLKDLPMKNGRIEANPNAFFPIFPSLARSLDKVLPGGPYLAVFILNCIASLATILIFYQCAKCLLEKKQARNAVILFALFPSSFIFFWYYSEAVCALLLVTAMYFLIKERLIISALIYGVAAASRPNAVFLCAAPAIYVAFRFLRNNKFGFNFQYIKNGLVAAIKSLALLIVSSSGFFMFMRYLNNRTGVDDAWIRIQREGWEESAKPFKGLASHWYYLFHFERLTYVIVGILSSFVYFLIIFAIIKYIVKDKYSPLSLALFLPTIIVAVLALANVAAGASLRFILPASATFIALSAFINDKYIKYVIPITAASLFILAFLYGWKHNAPFWMGAP